MGSFAALPLAFASRNALAAAPPALDYRAPSGCPDSASFVVAVEARGASFAAASAGAPAPRRLLVQIEPAEGGYAGSLVLQSGADTSEPRRVSGASCAEVSEALAVVTAIALQRDAEASTPAQSLPAAASAEPPIATNQTPAQVELVMGRKDVEVPAGKLVLDFISTYTLSAGVQLGAIPGLVLPRMDFSWSRTNTVTAPDGSAFALGNQFRVRWTMLGPITHRAPGYETLLFGVKAGIGGCTPLLYDPLGLTLKVCSEIAAGAIGLDTRNLDSRVKVEKVQGLASAGMDLDVHFNLSKLFHFDLLAGAEAWANRISAERADGSRLFQSPFVNGYVTVGVGVHF